MDTTHPHAAEPLSRLHTPLATTAGRCSLLYAVPGSRFVDRGRRARHNCHLATEELADGTRFAVGTGLSDAERADPPPVGSVITFRYQELSDGGVPRFPSYVGLRAGADSSPATQQGEATMTTALTMGVRRFEFREGSSDKFWEVSL